MKSLCARILGGLLMSCCVATSAVAEEQGTATLETMTVTAQKQEENVQDVPVGVTVFDDQAIEDIKLESVTELADFVPNLMMFEFGRPMSGQPTMRGVSASTSTESSTAVGIYVDGVPSGCTAGIFDIERIEVLRGPQGTLYGKDTEAGAINIITRQPDNTFRGKVSTELGEDNKYKGGVNLSGPLQEDKLFFSIVGEYEQKDGFIEGTYTGDTLDDREQWFGRGKLRWTPMESLDISLIVSRLSRDDDGTRMSLTPYGAVVSGLAAPEDRKMSSNVDLYSKSDHDFQALKAVYEINESYTLTSITARRAFSSTDSNDWDFSRIEWFETISDSEGYTISQELRLNAGIGKLKWIVGLYADDDHSERTITNTVSGTLRMDREVNGNSHAVFGQASYFLTEQINLIGGLRYEKQEREYEDILSGAGDDGSWEHISPKIALEYHLTPDIMSYASITEGYRPGAFNQLAADEQYASYDEEILWSYELGIKSAFFNRRLIVNGAVYYMNITDMQVENAVDPDNTYVTNAAEATGIGGELEISARLADGLTLSAGFGYSDITFDKYKDALGNYEGNHNPYAPDYTYNIGAQYRHAGGMYARVDLIGYGKMYFDRDNKYSRDPYELVNAKIGYEAEHYDVYLYGKNIFDTEYDSEGYYGGYYTVYSDPREVGIQLTYRF
ncbi:TonB-dependent receptor [uncultured Desulfobacter sp.]|uniref:TonB-dependent receptor n=1 Tax=uncultured Desulfobacter sp. TaxID=240139 RepID=UPI0029F479A5|nr:TonB-dependent receptor [uncultured Desulfobacter sp.]